MRIASKVNSDFISHIALIRSFSLGDNLTRVLQAKIPEYPLFPGEPIRYHFLFYMFIGVLEKLGLRIDWALNVPSIIGFFSLLTMIFFLSKTIFKNIAISILSVLFFLFNGSLAFIRFFTINPFSSHSLKDICNNSVFPAFAPWGPGEITAFWNLNIYTNQRHLAGAFGLILLFILTALFLENKPWKKQRPWSIVWGLTLSIFPYFHQPSLLILAIIMLSYWFLFPPLRRYLTVAGLLGIFVVVPQIIGVKHGPSLVNWYPGYLIHDSLNIKHFLSYWWQNLGLHSLIIPIGFLAASVKVKKIFFPFFPIFIISNLLTFAPETAANHKFFNFILIMGNMLTAYTLVLFLKGLLKLNNLLIRFLGFLSLFILSFFLVFSGIIDFFAIKNDDIGLWPDVNSHPLARWALYNTNPYDTILNADYISPISLSGRKIFLGWPYFSWSAGYDTKLRIKIKRDIFEAESVQDQCILLRKYGLSYTVLVSPPEQLDFIPNYSIFLLNGDPVFRTTYGGIEYSVYDTESYCDGV
ncbi:MAG: hypothetical protein WC988_02495 [Patescibacteria group bacterium]